MSARILDGKALAASVKAELAVRITKLKAAGITPGLGTVLVGDHPGSLSYVAGKHRDCQQVGAKSIRIDLKADASEAVGLRGERRDGRGGAPSGFELRGGSGCGGGYESGGYRAGQLRRGAGVGGRGGIHARGISVDAGPWARGGGAAGSGAAGRAWD